MESTVDSSSCSKCKKCIEVCPCNIIGLNQEEEVHFITERTSICLKCGQCMAVCSTKAVKVDEFSYDHDFTDLPDHNVDHNSFINFLANRRSIRNFKDKPISSELIHQILESVAYAPNGAEPEKINITVINNRTRIEAALPYIAEFLDNIVKWMEHPIASRMIRRKRGPEMFNTIKNHLYPIAKLENYKLEFGDRITRDAPAILIFHAEKGAEEHTNNSIIYATYTMLAAHALGLGATMIGIVPAAINKVKKVKEIFRIPEENEAVISVIIGYPKYKYQRTIIRKKQVISWID
jgi:nitroreductase/NAD-dependent dihydropyrimidine dehydrogenase PreA subunit